MKRALILNIMVAFAVNIANRADADKPLYLIDAPTATEEFGRAIATLGDINGDHAEDLLISSPAESTAADNAGAVRLISGLDRRVIRIHRGEMARQSFGTTLAAVGDVNRDGVADYAIASQRTPGHPLCPDCGCVNFFSGRDGSVLYRRTGTTPFSEFGHSVVRLGDLNGDGVNEVAVGEPNGGVTNDGAVHVLSGVNGRTLHTIAAEPSSLRFGAEMASAPDVNHDGITDLLVSAPLASQARRPRAGGVYLYSGASYALLTKRFGEPGTQELGSYVAALGDTNGDSRTDFAVTATVFSDGVFDERQVRILSGADLSEILVLRKHEPAFGDVLQALGDLDGDGINDLAVSTPYQPVAGTPYVGWVQIYAGLDGLQLIEFRHPKPLALGEFGRALATGDLNSDGEQELVLGVNGVRAANYVAGYSLRLPSLPALALRLHAQVKRDGKFEASISANRALSRCQVSLLMATSAAKLAGPITPLFTISTNVASVALTVPQKLPRVKGGRRYLYARAVYACTNGEQGVSNTAKINLARNRARGKKRTRSAILAIIAGGIGEVPV